MYMVAGFLMSSDSKKVVNPSWLQYANDLNFFIQYPWGNVCYNQTLDYIKTDLVAKFNKSSTTYNFYGCPWIFQVSFSSILLLNIFYKLAKFNKCCVVTLFQTCYCCML